MIIKRKRKKQRIKLDDARTAKNYLGQSELRQMELLVSMFLDYAELRIARKQTMTMDLWLEKLEGFLLLNDMPISDHPSTVTSEQMRERVKSEYQVYRSRLSYGGELPDEGLDFIE